MRELALFAGAGGGILGGHLLGWRTVCAVELDAYCRRVLLARQRDGHLPRFPIWDDVRTFDGRPWRGHVDVVSGGFPCQDISVAGRGRGLDGERSGLWVEMARIIREVRPRFAFVENSPALTVRGLGRVLADLAEMGFDARWGVLGAVDAGAPHRRERIWIVAANTERDGVRHEQQRLPWRRSNGVPHEGQAELVDDGEAWSVADSSSDGRESWGTESARVEGRLDAVVGGTSVADTDCEGQLQPRRGERQERRWVSDGREDVPDATGARLERCTWEGLHGEGRASIESSSGDWWATEPDVGRVAHELAARMDESGSNDGGEVR